MYACRTWKKELMFYTTWLQAHEIYKLGLCMKTSRITATCTPTCNKIWYQSIKAACIHLRITGDPPFVIECTKKKRIVAFSWYQPPYPHVAVYTKFDNIQQISTSCHLKIWSTSVARVNVQFSLSQWPTWIENAKVMTIKKRKGW